MEKYCIIIYLHYNIITPKYGIYSSCFQESQKVPKLTINLGPKRPMEHAFFAVRLDWYF